MKELGDYMKDKVDEVVNNLDRIELGDSGLNSMIKYSVTGGRRLRPALVFLACESVGGGWRVSVPAATAIELMHKFTLVHDDIIDKDEQRRGRSTTHNLYGQKNAIILGDIVSALSLNVLNELDSNHKPETRIKCYEVLSDTLNKLCEGEMKDLIFKLREGVDENEYFDVIAGKTAFLIESACRIGGIMGGGTDEEIQSLSEFGGNFGIAFQIINDVNNLLMEEKSGKRRGSDLRQGKLTLIVIKTHLSGSVDEKEKLNTVLDKKECSDKDLDEVIEMLIENGSIDYAMSKAEEYANRAREALRDVKQSKSKELMLKLIDHIHSESYWREHAAGIGECMVKK